MDRSILAECTILLVDDETIILDTIAFILESLGIRHIIKCSNGLRAMELITESNVDIVLLDLNMPEVSGKEVLQYIKIGFPHIPVIIVTAETELDIAVECMKLGADDYVVKPVESSRLLTGVRHALETSELQRENALLKTKMLSKSLENEEVFRQFITRDPNMIAIFQYIEAISVSRKPVLITGESGTGKELIARAVHDTSAVTGRFITVNVAGLEDSVFSDTLFGHVRGAFTGADSAREGLVVQAAGGSILLDEIGDLSPASQIKLLRLVQEGEYYPLGLDVLKYTDTRIICSTNKDLEVQIREKKFRSDLYYRLKTHHLHIPPLRERRSDIPVLVEHFLREAERSLGKQGLVLSESTTAALSELHFPGNVRELESIIFDAASRCTSNSVTIPSLPQVHGSMSDATCEEKPRDTGTQSFLFADRLPTLKEASNLLVNEAMSRAGQNQTEAAKLLGITQQALSRRLKNTPHT